MSALDLLTGICLALCVLIAGSHVILWLPAWRAEPSSDDEVQP